MCETKSTKDPVPLNILSAEEILSGPLTLITEIAPTPEGVAIAAIVSSFE